MQDIPKSHGGIIAVSQSGETRDTLKGESWGFLRAQWIRKSCDSNVCAEANLHQVLPQFPPSFLPPRPTPSIALVDTVGTETALKAAEMVGIPRLSVVNVVGSAIARETKMGVYLNAGRETAVASTKAFTTQVGRTTVVAVRCASRFTRSGWRGSLGWREDDHLHGSSLPLIPLLSSIPKPLAEGRLVGIARGLPPQEKVDLKSVRGIRCSMLIRLRRPQPHSVLTPNSTMRLSLVNIDACRVLLQVTVLSLMALWFRQVREAQVANPSEIIDVSSFCCSCCRRCRRRRRSSNFDVRVH